MAQNKAIALCIGFFLAVGLPAAALGGIGTPDVLRAGLDIRLISTHFLDYNDYYSGIFGYSTVNTWERYRFIGVRGDLLWNLPWKDRLSWEFGAGLVLYPLGGYGYEVGAYTGSGGAIAYGIDIPAQLSYQVSDTITAFGRMGIALLLVDAWEPDEIPPGSWGNWFYYEAFSEGLPDLYLAGGADIRLASGWVLSAGIRLTLIGLGAWTDYGTDPGDQGFFSFGLNAGIVREFGK